MAMDGQQALKEITAALQDAADYVSAHDHAESVRMGTELAHTPTSPLSKRLWEAHRIARRLQQIMVTASLHIDSPKTEGG